jgi:hypothetical protein
MKLGAPLLAVVARSGISAVAKLHCPPSSKLHSQEAL